MSERFPADASAAWREFDDAEYDLHWGRFTRAFAFRAGVTADRWPAITEPEQSITLDLSVIRDGAERAAANDAINAEALRAFVWEMPDVPELIVLDWQHPAHHFTPAAQALLPRAGWTVPVYPDGDYYAFLRDDLTEGTFGHPWEQTLCVFGDRLVDSLGRSLSTWLPVKRRGGTALP